MSPASAEILSTIDYLVPTSLINRRFWAPGKEYNTGRYAPYPMTIRNARLAEPFTLDANGFCLGRYASDITDWEHNYSPQSEYATQVCEIARSMSGADLVLTMGGMVRSSGVTSATVQPPAAEAHVDFTQASAERIAQRMYGQAQSSRPGLFPIHCFQSLACALAGAARHAAGALRRSVSSR